MIIKNPRSLLPGDLQIQNSTKSIKWTHLVLLSYSPPSSQSWFSSDSAAFLLLAFLAGRAGCTWLEFNTTRGFSNWKLPFFFFFPFFPPPLFSSSQEVNKSLEGCPARLRSVKFKLLQSSSGSTSKSQKLPLHSSIKLKEEKWNCCLKSVGQLKESESRALARVLWDSGGACPRYCAKSHCPGQGWTLSKNFKWSKARKKRMRPRKWAPSWNSLLALLQAKARSVCYF